MIKLTGVSKKYEKKIIENFTYQFEKGKNYVIVGSSGKGKTTLLNLIGMLEEADEGEVEINNIKNPSINSLKGQKILRNNISYMFQNYGLVDNETVEENLQLVLNKKADYVTSNILRKVNLQGMEHRKIASLSGGEQQRVAIAKILLKNSNIILCDEPTGNLDEENADIIMEYLLGIQDGSKVIIVVTHNKKYIEDFDEVINLEN